jgi:hypothetical protein
MRSLRARLFAAWMLSLLAAALVGTMLLGLYDTSSSAQRERAAEATASACEAIADGWSFFATGWAGPLPPPGSPAEAELQRELGALVGFALAGRPGLGGGLWQQGSAAPLVTSSPVSADILGSVTALVGVAAEEGRAEARLLAGRGAILVRACAAPGPLVGLVAFAIARVADAPGQPALILGVGGLFVLVLAMTALLGWAAIAWARRMATLERALAGETSQRLPLIPATGERDLDRLVTALNAAGGRLATAQAEAAALALRVAQSGRLAALGRVAAGVAHEVRNPVAAMRLRAENALAGDDARRRAALEAILGQVARLEHLTGELLTMTQPRVPAPAPCDLPAFLEAAAADHRTEATQIDVDSPALTAHLDATLLRRALDELLHNARHHSPAGGRITLRATARPDGIALTVSDSGPGVPEALRQTLFEPFVTGRPEGTGLGLAIAREMIETLGGRIALAETEQGATFRIELPCPVS